MEDISEEELSKGYYRGRVLRPENWRKIHREVKAKLSEVAILNLLLLFNKQKQVKKAEEKKKKKTQLVLLLLYYYFIRFLLTGYFL